MGGRPEHSGLSLDTLSLQCLDIKVEMARKHGLVEVEFRWEVHTGDICLRDLRVQMAFRAMG